jgi:hypothetical protein
MRSDPDFEATRLYLPISLSAEKAEDVIGKFEANFTTFSRS